MTHVQRKLDALAFWTKGSGFQTYLKDSFLIQHHSGGQSVSFEILMNDLYRITASTYSQGSVSYDVDSHGLNQFLCGVHFKKISETSPEALYTSIMRVGEVLLPRVKILQEVISIAHGQGLKIYHLTPSIVIFQDPLNLGKTPQMSFSIHTSGKPSFTSDEEVLSNLYWGVSNKSLEKFESYETLRASLDRFIELCRLYKDAPSYKFPWQL
jgi:hypothetical protein